MKIHGVLQCISPNSLVWNGQTGQGHTLLLVPQKSVKKNIRKTLEATQFPRCHFLSLIFSSPSWFFFCCLVLCVWGDDDDDDDDDDEEEEEEEE